MSRLGPMPGEDSEAINWQEFAIEGTSQALEKQYLRLTAVSVSIPFHLMVPFPFHLVVTSLIPIPPCGHQSHSHSTNYKAHCF